MKNTIPLTLLVVAVLITSMSACSAPSDDAIRAEVTDSTSVNIDNTGSDDTSGLKMLVDQKSGDLSFEGFGPGKSHLGKFNAWSGELVMKEGILVSGKGVIDMTSATTNSGGLDKHLLSADFFDVENYPTSEFTITKVEDGVAEGQLTFRGVQKQVRFPYSVQDGRIKADFVIDFSQFGMSYTGVNNEVRIFFDIAVRS